VTHPEDTLQEQAGVLERTLQGQVTKGFETFRINRDGKRFPVSISTAPLRDDNGKQMGMMATIEDISGRKRIERQLHDTTVTLGAINDALNSYLESGDWAVASKKLLIHALKQTQSKCGLLAVVLDTPHIRVLANEGVVWHPEANRQLYEAKLSQQAAKGYFDLEHRGNLFGEIIRTRKTVVTNEPSSDARSGGVPSGHQWLYSLLGVPIFKGESVVGLIAVGNRPGGYTGEESRALETISRATGVLYDNYRQELKHGQLEEQRLRLEGEFRQAQKMEVLGQLAGGIAHDFNNMLMVLSGSTELLEQSLPKGSPSDRYVAQIKRTVEKAAAITRQLLAFSRKPVLEIAPIDLHEVLTDSEFMLPRLIGSDIQLTFSHQAAHSWIRADAAQLEQVIANLAINARDAMPGGGALTISTQNVFSLPEGLGADADHTAESGWVVLEVSDTGIGMSEETRAHIFEPFFTTKPEGKGTGLGLPTVYGIVCQFSGYIAVDSPAGRRDALPHLFPNPKCRKTAAAAGTGVANKRGRERIDDSAGGRRIITACGYRGIFTRSRTSRAGVAKHPRRVGIGAQRSGHHRCTADRHSYAGPARDEPSQGGSRTAPGNPNHLHLRLGAKPGRDAGTTGGQCFCRSHFVWRL